MHAGITASFHNSSHYRVGSGSTPVTAYNIILIPVKLIIPTLSRSDFVILARLVLYWRVPLFQT